MMHQAEVEGFEALGGAERSGAARILVAEDSALVGAVLRAGLEADGHRVEHVLDGLTALERLLEGPTPDLLITDGDMPGIDGFELCRRTRAAGMRIPIIFVTSAAPHLVDALDAGADDFMCKPFEPAELSARVRAGLRAGHMAARLASERDRFAALVSSLQDGLVVFDASGRIVEANTRFSRIVGLGRHELVGLMPPFPFWPEGRHDRYTRRLARILSSGVGEESDLAYVRPDGRRRDVIASIAPVAGASTERAEMFVATVKDITQRRDAERALRDSEARHRALAEEQARLSRVASAVATSTDPADVFRLVGKEVAEMLGGDAGGVTRFQDGCAVLVGGWSSVDDLRIDVGVELPFDSHDATSGVWRDGRATRVDDYGGPTAGADRGQGGARLSSIAAPVRVAGRLWGTVGAISRQRNHFPQGAEERLTDFAALVSAAVAGADARAELSRRASTDPLTGLINRRVFDERLNAAASGTVSVAIFDLDHFKAVNDQHGHQAGDSVLRELAHRMVVHRRAGDTLARVGGEEFALLLPGAGLMAAAAVAERIRIAVDGTPFARVGHCTISCGVAELGDGEDGASLVRRADEALYEAKHAGRNRVAVFG